MKRIGSFIAGLLVGTMLFGGSVGYAAGVVAELSSHRFFVDGQEVKMTAYAINGNNYVMLRDIGKAVGFNVHWDSTNGCVQIESDKPYTGTAPAKTQSVAVGAKKADYTQADVMPEPKAGDKIPCSDGYVYEITDVSKYQNSMFATQETDTLPDPTCDWSLLDQPTLPEPEANHFTSGGKEYMFVRNLFETRRMQYTLYNAIGDNPQTWQNGKPVTRADGSPLVTVKLSIPKSVAANSFWPWRSDQIVELFNSCPPGEYAFEAWDVYCDGAFQYTEYYISVKCKLNIVPCGGSVLKYAHCLFPYRSNPRMLYAFTIISTEVNPNEKTSCFDASRSCHDAWYVSRHSSGSRFCRRGAWRSQHLQRRAEAQLPVDQRQSA